MKLRGIKYWDENRLLLPGQRNFPAIDLIRRPKTGNPSTYLSGMSPTALGVGVDVAYDDQPWYVPKYLSTVTLNFYHYFKAPDIRHRITVNSKELS